MKIVQIQKQSLIEYPGKISAVIFLGGCNFRCQFCYVPDLVLPERLKKLKPIPEKEVLSFLKGRKKFLEAVVISGGEPTINPKLPEFIKKIKKLGYLVEIETNGTNAKLLKYLVENKLVDYVAMDIKHCLNFKKYFEITGKVLTSQMFENIKESIEFLLKKGFLCEFRTTMAKEFHRARDILQICKKIKDAPVYYLQNFEPKETLSFKKFTPFSEEEIREIIEKGQKYLNIKFRKYL